MENREYTINGVQFKETKQYKYYIKKDGAVKWTQVKKSEFANEISLAKDDMPMIEVFMGEIAKPVARKLVRRYAKGYRSAVNWFDSVSLVMGVSHTEIKRHLKAI